MYGCMYYILTKEWDQKSGDLAMHAGSHMILHKYSKEMELMWGIK